MAGMIGSPRVGSGALGNSLSPSSYPASRAISGVSSSSSAVSASASPYRRSDLHGRTLDIIASVRRFESLSPKELADFLQLAQHESPGCSLQEALGILARRYGWDTSTRPDDTMRAWMDLEDAAVAHARSVGMEEGDEEDDDDDDESSDIEVVEKPNRTATSNKVNNAMDEVSKLTSNKLQVVLKRDATTRPFLLCEVKDPALSLEGDSGAIGRFSVGQDKLHLDIKGRQYSGHLFAGPTVLFLNITPAVGQAQAVTVARVEAVTSEFCRLEFERDLMQDLVGHYSGDGAISGGLDAVLGGAGGESDDDFDDVPRSKAARASKALKSSKATAQGKRAETKNTKGDSKQSKKGTPKESGKKRKRIEEVDSESDGSVEVMSVDSGNDGDDYSSIDAKGTKRASNPKISTITNRRRGGGGKSKASKGKKKAKK